MALQAASAFSADAVTYIAEKTLMIAKKNVIFQQLGDRVSLPSNNSRTFQYTRYDRLALPLAGLTEGVTPDNTEISISTVSATCDQFGAYVNLSDVAQLTIKHPVMVKAIDLMGHQAAETMDREIIQVLLASTSIVFPAAVATRAGLGASDVISTTVIRKAVSQLRARGAAEYDANDYCGVVDPYVEMDLSADSTFQTAGSYSNIKVLQNGEIGRWMGVRFMRSNLIPILSGVAAHTFTTPASPAGTFTAASYRVALAEYSKATGMLIALYQNDAVVFANLDSLGFTTPNTSTSVFKVFVGAAAGGATANLWQGVESTLGTGFIPANTAAVVLAPPSSGAVIAGSDIPATGRAVHFSWLLGKEAFTVVDLQKLQTFITPNAASDSDPLVQRRKAGWKFNFKSVINNQDFLQRIESASAFG